jgi:hypothetical protein
MEGHRQRAHKVEEEGREAILEGVYIGPRGERGVLSERIGDVVIGTVGIVVGLLGVVVVLEGGQSASK